MCSEMHGSEAYESMNFDKFLHHVYTTPVKI